MCLCVCVCVSVCLCVSVSVCANAICKGETEICIDYRAVTSLLNDNQFLLDVS